MRFECGVKENIKHLSKESLAPICLKIFQARGKRHLYKSSGFTNSVMDDYEIIELNLGELERLQLIEVLQEVSDEVED